MAMTTTTTINFSEAEILNILRAHLKKMHVKTKGPFTVTVRPHANTWDGVVIPKGANGDTVGIQIETEQPKPKTAKKKNK